MWDRFWTYLSDRPWSPLVVLALIYLLFFLIVGNVKATRDSGPDCHTEWDGRSNPFVCE